MKRLKTTLLALAFSLSASTLPSFAAASGFSHDPPSTTASPESASEASSKTSTSAKKGRKHPPASHGTRTGNRRSRPIGYLTPLRRR